MIPDSDHERLAMALAELRARVAELNNRDKHDNDDARSSLTVAWCNYHAMAQLMGLGSNHGQRWPDPNRPRSVASPKQPEREPFHGHDRPLGQKSAVSAREP